MADEIANKDEEPAPSGPMRRPDGGRGAIIFALLLIVAVLAGAWFLLNRHDDGLRPAAAVEGTR